MPTQVHIYKAMVFLVGMYGCKSWTIKKAEHWGIDDFELWHLEKTFESPLDCKESQPSYRKSVLNIHWKDRCWSWNSSILATWCEELTHMKRPWWWERLRAGGEGDDRGWDGWMASPTQWPWFRASFQSWWWTGKPGMLQSMGWQRVGHNWVTELNWTATAPSTKASSSVDTFLQATILIVLFFSLSEIDYIWITFKFNALISIFEGPFPAEIEISLGFLFN